MNATTQETRERVERLLAPPGNGHGAPGGDDLDWILFRSFPRGAVDADTFARLVPTCVHALDSGAVFDHELLFVRLIEMADACADGDLAEAARAAARRLLTGGFDPDETPAVVRFVVRALPDADDTLETLLRDPGHERLRFFLTADFLLDERDLPDYLALSYLRDSDPDAPAALTRHPVPDRLRERLARFLEPEVALDRIRTGWKRWASAAECDALRDGIAARWPHVRLND
ncbi:MAG TPA: hypothetical protein VKU85_03975 [bacterium]|nr:hypothetical protein [bacterium]